MSLELLEGFPLVRLPRHHLVTVFRAEICCRSERAGQKAAKTMVQCQGAGAQHYRRICGHHSTRSRTLVVRRTETPSTATQPPAPAPPLPSANIEPHDDNCVWRPSCSFGRCSVSTYGTSMSTISLGRDRRTVRNPCGRDDDIDMTPHPVSFPSSSFCRNTIRDSRAVPHLLSTVCSWSAAEFGKLLAEDMNIK